MNARERLIEMMLEEIATLRDHVAALKGMSDPSPTTEAPPVKDGNFDLAVCRLLASCCNIAVPRGIKMDEWPAYVEVERMMKTVLSPRQHTEKEKVTRVDDQTVIPPERATAAENQTKDTDVLIKRAAFFLERLTAHGWWYISEHDGSVCGDDGTGPQEVTECQSGDDAEFIAEAPHLLRGLLAVLSPASAPPNSWQPIEAYDISFGPVIVALDGGQVGEAHLTEDDGWWWAGNDPTDAHGMRIYPMLFMPLPAPPAPPADHEEAK